MAAPKHPGGNAGLGRPKGVPNKFNRDIREMILGALNAGGGQRWLQTQMDLNPVAFMHLVGRIIPQQIDATIRRELPQMTREDLLELLEKMRSTASAAAELRAAKTKVIEHRADAPSVELRKKNE